MFPYMHGCSRSYIHTYMHGCWSSYIHTWLLEVILLKKSHLHSRPQMTDPGGLFVFLCPSQVSPGRWAYRAEREGPWNHGSRATLLPFPQWDTSCYGPASTLIPIVPEAWLPGSPWVQRETDAHLRPFLCGLSPSRFR